MGTEKGSSSRQPDPPTPRTCTFLSGREMRAREGPRCKKAKQMSLSSLIKDRTIAISLDNELRGEENPLKKYSFLRDLLIYLEKGNDFLQPKSKSPKIGVCKRNSDELCN